MKKIIILASALVLGGTAFAQDASMQPPAAGATTPAPATPDASMPAASTPDSSMPAASTPPATTPDASAPAATTPDSSMPASGAPSTTPTTTDTSNLPMCSKTVTDSCKQGSGGSMHHKAMHKKK